MSAHAAAAAVAAAADDDDNDICNFIHHLTIIATKYEKKTETISVYATVIVGRINRLFHLTFLFSTTVQFIFTSKSVTSVFQNSARKGKVKLRRMIHTYRSCANLNKWSVRSIRLNHPTTSIII